MCFLRIYFPNMIILSYCFILAQLYSSNCGSCCDCLRIRKACREDWVFLLAFQFQAFRWAFRFRAFLLAFRFQAFQWAFQCQAFRWAFLFRAFLWAFQCRQACPLE